MNVPPYDQGKVNSYLIAVKKNAYVISDTDQDYDIWLSYLDVQEVFNYNQFKDIDAGIALIRIYFKDGDQCMTCDCYPRILLEMAYGSQWFIQSIYNVKSYSGGCCNDRCC